MSLYDHLTADDVINSIRLQRRHPFGAKKIWIVVEGIDDQKLFKKLINGADVEIETSGGIKKLLIVVAELLKETNLILGIRDADFLHLEKKEEAAAHIFLTDYHDAEMMIISCDNAFNQVIAEYCSSCVDASALRVNILKSISFIGGIRWINSCNDLELNFQKLGLGNFYNGATLALNKNECLDAIMARSPVKRAEIHKKDVELKIDNISDLLNLCHGHDFQQAFKLYVNSLPGRDVNDKTISAAFRLVYRFDNFCETYLFRQLLEWAKKHSVSLFTEAPLSSLSS
ncbi:MAG TPA: DUF4435 domain-containing protein [Acidobacteriota bacterium]|nr:DUF4435 domain-containing protein [Acidobacteriota bacterium]HQO19505.1 DUF4435 domain-containing protein [Acidobacteriota bacterium]HQQ45966.1 DUF4435 domain-containing protein [Acidobacteriota bacterium]